MRVFVINPGSSSLKLAVVEDGQRVVSLTLHNWDGSLNQRHLRQIGERAGPVDAVGVRVVHGGDRTAPKLLDDGELLALAELQPLAPMHQERSLAMARMARALLPHTPVVGCFDTAFHTGLPEHAATYPVPRHWARKHRVRRYGFHGLSCGYALRRAGELLGRDPIELRLLCCHVGAGVSVTAISGGRSLDTSMGFTPMDGAAMATRPGSLDPGVVLYMQRLGRMTVADVEQVLDRRCGLAGMSGTTGDVREVLDARQQGDHDADLALRVYVHRLSREIAAASVSLDRLDALVFTGGVAEHQPGLCAEIVTRLALLGVTMDSRRNAASGDRVVSPAHAEPQVLVVEAREDLEIARETTRALRRDPIGAGNP
jgi:acetate kinase